jgi:hypothetical protein
MAKRVKQADGRYCYTDNCRVHDRSADSTGVQAILNDAKLHQVGNFNWATSVTIQENLGINEDKADTMGQKIVEAVLNSTNGDQPYEIAEALKSSSREEGIDPFNLEVIPAAYAIHKELMAQSLIQQGDEVVIRETGERGTIAEGDSMFGGAVRFNPENSNSRNSFAWLPSTDVSKVAMNSQSPMRQKIFASSRHSLIAASNIKTLIDEETSPNTPNAQGTKEFGKHAKAARKNLLTVGDSITANLGDNKLSKNDVLAVLQREYEMPMDENIPEAEVKATKSGLRNIIGYLDPTGDMRNINKR